MARDAERMRGARPFLFANARGNKGVEAVAPSSASAGGSNALRSSNSALCFAQNGGTRNASHGSGRLRSRRVFGFSTGGGSAERELCGRGPRQSMAPPMKAKRRSRSRGRAASSPGRRRKYRAAFACRWAILSPSPIRPGAFEASPCIGGRRMAVLWVSGPSTDRMARARNPHPAQGGEEGCAGGQVQDRRREYQGRRRQA